MINIYFTDYALTQHPVISTAADNSFSLQLGPITNALIPRPVSSSVDPMRNGSSFQINLRPHESFALEDVVFEILVDNAKNGGDVSFLNRLIQYVQSNILIVQQDNGAILSAGEILNYSSSGPFPSGIFQEEIGMGTGLIFIFYTSFLPVVSSLMVFRNGTFMEQGAGLDQYTAVGTAVTFNTAPAPGQNIDAWYVKA